MTTEESKEPLKAGMIASPGLVRLYMRVGRQSLECMLYNPYEDRSLIYRRIGFTDAGEDAGIVKSIENAVYDNPLLLEGEFGSVAVSIDTPKVAAVPSGAGVAEEIYRLWRGEGDEGDHVMTVSPPGSGATLAAGVDVRLWNFLRRTFPTARLTHPLATMIAYGMSKSSGASPRMFVNMHGDSIEAVVASSTRLYEATRFEASGIDDMAFYLLSVMSLKGQEPDEVLVAGGSSGRRELIESLRRFHPYVMPMIFPSEMHRAGANGEEMPFDLVVMPLTM